MPTDLLSLLTAKKMTLIAHGSNPVSKWKECWTSFLQEIPAMQKNGECWLYYHRGAKRAMCGTDVLLKTEFESLEAQGLTTCDNSDINAKELYCIIPHPKKKKMGLRCDLSFRRYLGTPDEDGDCKGSGMCPILWGLGVMADGLTYMNVKITEVPLDKGHVKIAFNLINCKWAADEDTTA